MADDAAAPTGELSEPASEPVADSVEAEASEAEFLGEDEAEEDYPELNSEDAGPRMSHVRLATIVGLVVVLALGGLVGWLSFRAYQSHQLDTQRKVFLQVGRQGAINLTTIDYQHVDDDVKRILDSATGKFYDDFQQRSQPFTEVVKQVKSKSVGTVTEAGLESESDDEAQVLVAVAVNTTVEGQPEQQPRAWRMRILVQKVGDDTKVSNVEFVP
ncbi:Mce protein [Mycolicibacterium sp. P9-64]|uniref:Mce protein n=1 Tax=Mycolicibacterium sp. P9-64 TaxID=2024612 RepID=UPI0011EBC9A4|nr:Mce protein [Mycolicibacterium sp. P9-64]KAA0080668.1 Mce protein [Mycolicibacterium sp. P9-64]